MHSKTSTYRVLMLSNWSANDGIAKATILPILRRLTEDSRVRMIVYVSMETAMVDDFRFNDPKIKHIPVGTRGNSLLGKSKNLVSFLKKLKAIITDHNIDFIWARGSSAGGIASIVGLLGNVPYIVDSFEPHSSYMRDAKVWSRFGLKYLVQRMLERQMRKHARVLLPVSNHYLAQLLSAGFPGSRLHVCPCAVDVEKFRYRFEYRDEIRRQLGCKESDVVGIYVGKFGGLYYDSEAFQVFKCAMRAFHDSFFLIILSESERDMILTKCHEAGINRDKIYLAKVSHDEVPKFLSAADYAISTIKPLPSLKFCSPIKHGEYWAADLPIVSTLNVGDDAEIIKEEGGGYIIETMSDADNVFATMQRASTFLRNGVRFSLANRYRNPELIGSAVDFVLNKF